MLTGGKQRLRQRRTIFKTINQFALRGGRLFWLRISGHLLFFPKNNVAIVIIRRLKAIVCPAGIKKPNQMGIIQTLV
ncbi:hypothetical protein [Pantoea sp. 1B4]|uniref:hypothetical protein n=1 Tax=Pantoea sp. 1B4 TaxID=2804760 RepID=UPI001AA2252C|nr:hypothetical protein [Pantoea sp. 1B4]MBN1087419.1 hypothetical protein [Pantoea sp. 1B4]